jgi:hypothetical protein
MQKLLLNTSNELMHCKNCAFSVQIHTPVVGQWIAECRFLPPCIVAINNSPVMMYPLVNDLPEFFCFQFQEKEKN